jgi:uncharacterized protein (TIGR02300 family)
VAKPEWGVKRTCQSCGARFYDMARTPIVCPKCETVVEPEITFKPRRQAAVAEPKVVPVVVDQEVVDLDEVAEDIDTADAEDAEDTTADAEEEDDGALIEDASDLGEDDDDMAEVMEHIDEDLENEI